MATDFVTVTLRDADDWHSRAAALAAAGGGGDVDLEASISRSIERALERALLEPAIEDDARASGALGAANDHDHDHDDGGWAAAAAAEDDEDAAALAELTEEVRVLIDAEVGGPRSPRGASKCGARLARGGRRSAQRVDARWKGVFLARGRGSARDAPDARGMPARHFPSQRCPVTPFVARRCGRICSRTAATSIFSGSLAGRWSRRGGRGRGVVVFHAGGSCGSAPCVVRAIGGRERRVRCPRLLWRHHA